MTTATSRPSVASPESPAAFDAARVVTLRAFLLGLLLASGLAALNAWIENVYNVHFLGGVQMPFGAIVSLAILVIFVNGPLKWVRRLVPRLSRAAPPLSSVELLTIYAMLVFAALISTPGNENSALTIGPALFYFSTRENGWASLFYQHIPRNFAPGWDGSTFQKEVIEPFYIGGVTAGQIPWHAWSAMLIAWGIFTLLLYCALFFGSLVLRRQWIENEALAFPLVQLPLQMVEGSAGENAPPTGDFWLSRAMWMGTGLAFSFHLLRGLNNYFPDWPVIPSFQGNVFKLELTEVPWSSAGTMNAEYFFGAIGIAFLLTRELSFSFWFFFLLYKLQLVGATMLGFPSDTLPKDTHLGRPTFITNQSVGGWLMIAALLLWAARGHLQTMWHEVLRPTKASAGEPFSARFTFVGLILSVGGLGAWCWFAGLNFGAALAFFGLYALTSLVLARLVVEGGFLFPQATFAPLEVLTGSVMGAGAMGGATLTKLSFIQPGLFSDMRANLLPAYLHALKIAFDLRLTPRQTRRLMLCALAAVVVSLGVSTFVTIVTLYSHGGLSTYGWFSHSSGESVFKGTATMISKEPGVSLSNWTWMASGAGLVWAMAFARARFVWFPLHPLAFIVSSGFPITRLWLSFFIGWLIKSLLLKFGGQDSVQTVRPFMIGLILGNAAAMVLWMLYGLFAGTQIPYWPA